MTKEPAKADALVGRVLADKIEIIGILGAGAMGQVYLGHHRVLDKSVAVKVLARRGEIHSARFLREARAASRLDHPNAVRILDSGEDGPDRLQYIVMERLEGEDLRAVLSREGKLAAKRVIEIAIDVSSALAAAHAQGFVHRDVKPANIMLHRARDEGGRTIVKVLDFGLAKSGVTAADESDASERSPADIDVTAAGVLLGTPAFRSPEQARKEPIDGRSDVFSLGIIMYGALTGKRPYKTKNIETLARDLVEQRPPPPSVVDPTIDPALSALVMRALEVEASARPTAAQLRDALIALRHDATVSESEALPSPLSRSSGPGGALALALAAAALGAALLTWSSLDEGPSAAVVSSDERPSPSPALVTTGTVAPRRVRLEITGAPEGTEVIDSRRGVIGVAPGELLLEASDAPTSLTLRAPGHHPKTFPLLLDRDQSIAARLEPLPTPKPTRSAAPRDRHSLENPFQ